MAILNADALREIESKVARWRENNGRTPHGYPLSEVDDLCDTIAALKSQKKKWQRLAEIRGKVIDALCQVCCKKRKAPMA